MEYRPLGRTGLKVSVMSQGGAAIGQGYGPVSVAEPVSAGAPVSSEVAPVSTGVPVSTATPVSAAVPVSEAAPVSPLGVPESVFAAPLSVSPPPPDVLLLQPTATKDVMATQLEIARKPKLRR